MIRQRQSIRAVLSSLLLLGMIAPVAARATMTTVPTAVHTPARPRRSPHVSSPAPATLAQQARLLARYAQLPLSFEVNQGQAPHQVRFLARGAGYTLSLTAHGATLTLASPSQVTRNLPPSAIREPRASLRPHLVTRAIGAPMRAPVSRVMPMDTVGPQGTSTPIPSPSGTAVVIPTAAPFTPAPPITATTPLTGTALAQTRHRLHHAHAHKGKKRHAPPAVAAVVQLAFVGANAQPHIVGIDALPGIDNYLLGRQRAQWRTRVPTYARIAYQGVYPGIDLVYHGRQGHLEYDWRLAPHAAVRHIQLAVHGAAGLRLDSQGALVIGTQGGTVRQDAPVAYQEINGTRRTVAARYVLLSQWHVGLDLAAYDHGKPLVIDPVLSYATYLGGSGVDQATGIAVDGSGNIYVAGNTTSTNFPTTTGAYSTTFAGGTSTGDAFVSKLSADGSTLLYSTYLGGSGDEDVSHIAVDGAGEAEIVGYTDSTNYPTINATQGAYGGGVYNAFASKLSADGSALVYSTYLGGNGDDEAYSLAVDSAGDAYVAGLTSSTNFPLKNALQGTFSGGYDAFVTEFDPNGALLYSTYLGGSGDDDAYGIAIDGAGSAYVTGATTSPNFPVSATAYQRRYTGVCSGGT